MEIELKKKTYEELQQELVECILKSRAYEKALDKASDILYDLNDCDNLRAKNFGRCPFYDRCESLDKCIASKEKWKEWLLKEDE